MKRMKSLLVKPRRKREKDDDTTILCYHEPAIESLPLTVEDEMQVMFIILLFSQLVVEKLAIHQGIYSPQNIASISDELSLQFEM